MAPGKRGAVAGSATLDDIDRAIIEALQADGRVAFREIARSVEVAEGTIRNRYERLTGAGVLEVVGVTNPLALGFGALAMLGVTTRGASQPIAEAIAELDAVSYVVVITGRFDLLVEVVCRTHEDLLETIERIQALDGVVATESFVYLKLTKQSYQVGRLPRRELP